MPLHKYIELYEQVFEIDLYAYRVTFQYEKQGINKLEDLKDEGILGDKDIEIELIVESVGGWFLLPSRFHIWRLSNKCIHLFIDIY